MDSLQAQIEQAAQAIYSVFDSYHCHFKEITRRACPAFETRNWAGMNQDMVERLDVYTEHISQIVTQVKDILGEDQRNKATWMRMKHLYSEWIADRDDYELAETFFNSLTRRIFTTVGVDPKIEFVDSDFQPRLKKEAAPIYSAFRPVSGTEDLVRAILSNYVYAVSYQDFNRDVKLAAAEIDKYLSSFAPGIQSVVVEMLNPVFYRNKGANLIGRIYAGGSLIPLVFALRNEAGGLLVDAVLLTESDVSIMFSFTRSYFHVEIDRPHELIEFLKTLMPLKRVAELYISIGYNKHGKTELFRDLIDHLENSTDRFEIARGERGMVMVVFTLPSYDMVFKVIRDTFAEPKTTTRQRVKERYQLVFKHDRAGRLVDAQEFEHLRFRRDRFSESLLKELLESASSSVTVDGDTVSIQHLYTERRMIPLDIYVREADHGKAREAVLDYGFAIKDLAATNIFPGDVLLKNFGVTRHGRVVFYDYDELCLVTDCKFRSFPQASRFHDEYAAEPWFYVSPIDIFPQEFETFLGLQGDLREAYLQVHSDLFTVSFWRNMQQRHEQGEILDIYPYKQSKRLPHP